MSTAHHLAAIDRLRAQPGARVEDLRVSEGFWDDDGSGLPAAQEEFATDCDALATVLARRWGPPERLDLTDCLVRVVEGEPVPEPFRGLSGYVPAMYGWTVHGRWTGIGVGRQGPLLPLQLVAAVGEEPPDGS